MNELQPLKYSQNSSQSYILRAGFTAILMGILSNCTTQKPISTDDLIRYPSIQESINQPIKYGGSEAREIERLSRAMLYLNRERFVDDFGREIPTLVIPENNL